eukprot:775610-Prymnesium_polylepis.1
MERCAVVRTAQNKFVAAPVLGWLTTKNRKKAGDRPVKSGFLATGFFHPPNEPDKVGVEGLWVPDSDELEATSG